MWPWGHLAVAYLCYSLVTNYRFDSPPREVPAIALAVGSQFPDALDKPLSWTFGVLPGGRTLTHSLLLAAILVPAVVLVAGRIDRRSSAVAFAVGYISHLIADVPPSVLRGDLSGTAYLLWPILEPPSYENVSGVLEAILTYYEMGAYEAGQLALFVVAAVVWYRDGAPGLAFARPAVERVQSVAR